MKNPIVKFAEKITKFSFYSFIGIVVILVIAFLIAAIYQATSGNGSIFEVSRNVSLPEDTADDYHPMIPIISMTYQDLQLKYHDLSDDEWRFYGFNILGNRVNWSGRVSDIDSRRVEIDMGNSPLRYLVLLGISSDEKAQLSIGKTIEFEGRLQSFHVIKGMTPVLDNVEIK
jgi:hypothetical protein